MITKRDIRFMDIAIEMSKGLPRFADHRIAAILAIKGQLVSTGFNIAKKHPIALKYARDYNPACIYPHAEVVCIHNASKKIDLLDFNKATLYVARAKKMEVNGNDVWGMARPCNGCQRCIESFGIKKVIYTNDEGNLDELFS